MHADGYDVKEVYLDEQNIKTKFVKRFECEPKAKEFIDIFIVKWCEKDLCFYGHDKYDFEDEHINLCKSMTESQVIVIGNIYENPELIH